MNSATALFAIVCMCAAFSCFECCPKQIKKFFTGPDKKEFKVEYQGCFPGEAHVEATEYAQLRIVVCNKKCFDSGYKYFGLKQTKCFCESFMNADDKLDDNQCTIGCPGDANEKCGGDKSYSLYTAGKKYP